MFKQLAGFLSKLTPVLPVDRLPADPETDAIEPISIRWPLEPGEAAYLEVPAGWYRLKARRRHAGVSVRVASGVYLRGGVSEDGEMQPSLISDGTAIFTNIRVIFVGKSKSASFCWKDVAQLEEGLDHIKLFHEDGDTEVLRFLPLLMRRGDGKLGKLVWRLWCDQPNHRVVEPVSQSEDSECDRLIKVTEALEADIKQASNLDDLEQAFKASGAFLQSHAHTFGDGLVKASRAVAEGIAIDRLQELLDEGGADIAKARYLWRVFGSTDPFPSIHPSGFGGEVSGSELDESSGLETEWLAHIIAVKDATTPDDLEAAFAATEPWLDANAPDFPTELMSNCRDVIQNAANINLVLLYRCGTCSHERARELWRRFGNAGEFTADLE